MLAALMNTFDIQNRTRNFNADDSGFSTLGMSFGRSKCVVRRWEKGDTGEIQFRGSCDHVILMPVVSAAGQIMKPLVVLQGIEE